MPGLMRWRGGGRCGLGGWMPELITALRQAAPLGVVFAEGDATAPLWPGEALAAAVPKRLAEFTAGRSAARRAMAQLGLPPAAVPMQADRSPLWPATVTGSISHCASACIAAMAHARDYAGLGLDLEPLQPLTADLWPLVLTPPELARLPQEQPGLMALQIFCAKEAAYKAQYALTGQLFDFQTLEVEVQGQNFVARFQHAVGRFGLGACLGGVLRQAAGIQAALVWIA